MNIKNKLDLKTKRSIWGYIFVIPFIIGTILFFISPLIQTIIYSLSRLEFSPEGYTLHFRGLSNYHQLFFVSPNFVRNLVELVADTLTKIPLVLLFSFFVANVLNQEFRGRFLARTIFFLPVIITSEAVIQVRQSDFLHNVADMVDVGDTAEISDSVRTFLLNLRLPEEFLNYFIDAVAEVPEIINESAIPIVVFLAGLQAIPKSLYESANIDGATGWERFWKITFPMITPLILVNIVFVVINSFDIIGVDFGSGAIEYGVAAADGIIHFLVVTIILAVFYAIISRYIFYYEE